MPTTAAPKRDRRQPAPGYEPIKLYDNVWLLVLPVHDAETDALVKLEYVSLDEGPTPNAPRTYRRRADAVRDSHTDYLRRQNELQRAELARLYAQLGTNPVSQRDALAVS